jgi:serine/threonine protein kinase/tetratricopeptide (TPR) repeat protein
MNRPSDRASLNIFDQIDSICREYRALWKQGNRPRLEKWIGQVPEDAQPQLFLNLLQTEVAFRQRLKETVASDDYVKRFPQFTRQVRQAFHEQSLISMDEQEGSPIDSGDPGDETHTMATPTARRLGDYELLRELGRGGMGVVYEARHFKNQNRVALKTLPSGMDGQDVNADRLHRFRREFRSLSEINHPNLVGMQTLEVDGTQWFFTMDLIEGVDYLDYVRPSGQLDETRLRSSLAQLIRGIMALHQRRIVHRDIKPSNVMVEQDGTVKILDFGLVAELQQVTDFTQTRSTHFAGTPKYAAPEQMFGQRSEASDWYAVGVMLFEALNGHAPFMARDPMELLRQKQTTDPPSLADRTDLPVDLAALADALLKREPKERWTIATILEHLGLNSDTRMGGSSATAGSTDSHGSSVSGAEDLERAMLSDEEDIVLIGREKQLAQLEEARQELLRTRKPVVVWISGLSGEGKSSLVEKFLRPLRKGTEMLVLSGRCYDRESVPFKAVDCLIEALVNFLRSRPTETVVSWLPDDIPMLVQLFPLLRRVPVIDQLCGPKPPTVESKQARYRAFAALRELLVAISQVTPVVLFVDDLQWGDADSAEAMFDLLQPSDGPVALFIGSYRKDEADSSAFLNEWKQRQHYRPENAEPISITVSPLTPEQCIELAAQRVGVSSDVLRRHATSLFTDTHGNPYFLEQLVEGFDRDTETFRSIPLRELVSLKLTRLPPEAAHLLDVIAVAGRAVSIGEVSVVAGLDKPAMGIITHMRSERLVRLVGIGEQLLFDTFHDKIRETLLQQLSSERRKLLHERFANVLEKEATKNAPGQNEEKGSLVNDRLFEIAHHYWEAGHARAFEYQLRAGEMALDAFAMETALNYFRNAEQCQPNGMEPELEYRLHSGLGKALAGCNSQPEAISHFDRAIAASNNKEAIASCLYAQGEVYWRNGDYEEGSRRLQAAFSKLGEYWPETTLGRLLSGGIAIFAFHCLPAWVLTRLSRRTQQERLLLSRMFTGLNWNVFNLDPSASVYACGRNALNGKLMDDTKEKAECYAIYGGFLAFIGLHWLGHRVLQRVEPFYVHTPEREKGGAFELYHGLVLSATGELIEADRIWRIAIQRFDRIRSHLAGQVRHFLWHLWSTKGDFNQLIRFAAEEWESAVHTGDPIVLAYSQYGLAEGFARQGRTSLAIELTDKAVSTLERVRGAFLCVGQVQQAKVRLQVGDFRGARESAAAAIRWIPRLRFIEFTAPAFGLHVESIVGSAWVDRSMPVSRKDLRKAAWSAFAARWSSWAFPNLTSYGYRVSGRLAMAKNKERRAMEYFDKAIAAAEKIGAHYELARTWIDKSLLEYPQAASDRQRGLALLESLGCVLPDAEVEYLSLDRAAHHARAAAAHKEAPPAVNLVLSASTK